MYFNDVMQVCDLPENVNCNLCDEVIKQKTYTSPVECEQELCPDPEPGECPAFLILKNATDCTKFIQCENGISKQM